MENIAIIGGGIGGLCLAIALQKQNIEVDIYENAPEIKPLGAGLVLAANAMKALEEIGIADEVIKAGKILEKINVLDDKGNTITETDSRKISAKFGTHNLAIHRVDLHHILVKHLKPNTFHLNKKYADLEQDGDAFIVKFADGSSIKADAMIAADGIHSLVRQKLVPTSKKRYAGYTCWRAVIKVEDSVYNQLVATETWGQKGRIGIVPLSNHQIYWFACVNAPANDPKMKNMTKDDLFTHFKDFHAPIPQILERTKNEDLIWNDIIDLEPINKFAFGKIALMGDAAHATTPNMGQGACQAIEDAVVLANCMKKEADIAKAFQLFERKRIARVTKIVNTSWSLGKIAQLENSLLIKLRNFFFRLIPSSMNRKQLDFLYKVDFK